MRRWVGIALLIPLLVIPTSAPASGVFGLGKCDKVIKQIENESQINLQLKKQLNKLVYALNNAYKEKDEIDYIYRSITLSDSFIRIYKLVVKNSNCFTPAAVAETRTAMTILISKKGDLQKFLREENYWGEGGRTWEKSPESSSSLYFKQNRR